MRRILIGLGAVLGLLAALVAALPWLAEPAARAGLRLAGVEDVRFDRLRFDWQSLEIDGITVGRADREVRRVRVAWRLPDLLDGRLGRVEIEGLTLRAAWRDGGLRLAGIEAADTGGVPGLPIPDVDEATLRDARLALETDLGTLQMPFSAQLRSTTAGRTFQGRIAGARSDGLSADGSFAGEMSPAFDQVRLSGSIALVARQAALGDLREIEGQATLDIDLAGGLLRVDGAIADAAWQGGSLEDAKIALTAEGGGEAAHGTLDLALAGAALTAGDLTLSGTSLNQTVTWSYAADALSVEADEPGTLAIGSVAAPDLGTGSLQARIEPADAPLFTLAFAGQEPAWSLDGAAVIETAEARLTAPTPLELQSRAGRLTLAAQGAGTELSRADLVLAEGQVLVPEHALALEGIATEAALAGTGLVPGPNLPIRVERIQHGGEPAWFAPLALQAGITPDGETISFQGSLTRIGGGLAVDVRGNVQPSGAGSARIALAPVVFGPDLQPASLAPAAGSLVREVTGTLALNGDLAWGLAGITGDAALLVDQMGFSTGPARLERINGVVRLDRLWPPSTPPGQQLAIGLLDIGLPLTAGVTTFRLADGPRLEVEQLQWALAGGTARAEPFTMGSPVEPLTVTLRAEALDLGQLLALTRLDGLSGEGSLDGVLPLRVSDGVASIAGGRLAATGPGVLRYAADAAPAALRAGGEGVDLLLQALENFRYEALEITLDGRTDAAMDIGLHLAGANPDLYDGYPLEFNLDLEGELVNILRQGIASYQIPDRIRERMQGFGR